MCEVCVRCLCVYVCVRERDTFCVRCVSWSEFLFLHKHHDQEASWGGKGLFSLHFHTAVHHQGSKDGTQAGQEAGADAEAMEGCSLLACLPGLLSLLSYRTKTTSPEMAQPTRRPPTLITN